MNVTNERELVARFLSARDDAAFRELYRRHTPVLYLLARRLLGEAREHAEDVVQEAWIRGVTALPGFQWRSSLQTWLCGITVNCARETLRRLLPQSAPDEDALETQSGPPHGFAELEALIAALPRTARHVLLLHDVYGYTHEEIGGWLEIEAGTSKHHLFRARRKLREWLGAIRAGDLR